MIYDKYINNYKAIGEAINLYCKARFTPKLFNLTYNYIPKSSAEANAIKILEKYHDPALWRIK